MSGKLKLQYTLHEGRYDRKEVTDHERFHTPKSARIRAKTIRGVKPNAKDFRIVDDQGKVTELEFSDTL